MVTIRQKYDALKAFLVPGIANLTDDEIILARSACEQLIAAIPEVQLSFELEDYRRTFLNQIKIIKRQLDDLAVPTYTAEIWAVENTSLYALALDYLGNALRWVDIAKLNNIKTDPFLTVAMLVKMPRK
jgi:hypothetical protein